MAASQNADFPNSTGSPVSPRSAIDQFTTRIAPMMMSSAMRAQASVFLLMVTRRHFFG